MNGKHYVGNMVSSFQRYDDIGPVTGIALVVDDDNEYLAGDQNGYVLEVSCAYGTQAMADQLLAAAKGKVYKGYSASKAPIPPMAELGDAITVSGLYGLLASREVDFGGGHYSDIAAPGENAVEHRYPVGMTQSAKIKRSTDRKIAQTRSSITKTAEEIRLEVEKTYATKGEVSSSITQTADSIRSEVSNTYATKTALSSVEQTADKIGWLVKSGTSASDFELTDRAAKLAAESIDLTGYVTFNSLKGSGTTEINGANLQTGTVSADKISVKDLSALDATIGGWTIGTGLTYNDGTYMGGFRPNHPTNVLYIGYKDEEGDHYPFVLRRDGSLTASNAKITGEITATGGEIGGWTIGDGLNYDDGNNRFIIRPKATSTSDNVLYAGYKAAGGTYTYPFAVTKDGHLRATDATISGTITANGGTIGKFNIGESAIYNGLSTLDGSSNGVYVGTDGIALGRGKFKVTNAGVLTAESGTIGGFTIDDQSIRTGELTASEAGNVALTTRTFTRTIGGTSRDALRFAIGQSFAVNNNGVLYASNVHIKGDGEFSGKVTATSGTFTGTVNASGGEIGGWSIGDNGLSYEDENNRFVVRPKGSSSSAYVLYAGYKDSAGFAYPFAVTKDGKLRAREGTFESVTISGSSFTGTNDNDGTISGGTISDPSISGGTLGGGTSGTFSGGTLSGCTLGGTSLTVNGGSISNQYSGAALKGDSYATIRGGANGYVGTTTSETTVSPKLNVYGDISCSGDKTRVIGTDHFGKRCLSAYETPLPTFSDYGTAALDETGVFYIVIDPIFAETVNEAYLPTVFLTKYGEGDIWVESVTHDIVTVRGTPGLEFAWEARYAQENTRLERLRVMDFDYQDLSGDSDFDGEANIAYEHSKENIDYAEMGYKYFTEFERSVEAA